MEWLRGRSRGRLAVVQVWHLESQSLEGSSAADSGIEGKAGVLWAALERLKAES